MGILEGAKKEELKCPDCAYRLFRKITFKEVNNWKQIMLQCEQCDYVVAQYEERAIGG